MELLITNGILVTWGNKPNILGNSSIYIQSGRIRAIGSTVELKQQYPNVTELNANGQLVMPGNTCAHTHFYGAYARGMVIPGNPPANFPQILSRLWWPLDKALSRDSVRLSALVCLLDAIKHGTTSLIDHHASPNFIDGSLNVIAEVVEQSGLRAVLCYEVTDRDGRDKLDAGIAENLRFMHQYAQHPRVRGTFGLHASLTLDDPALQACVEAAPSDAGFHIHVGEHEADQEDSLRRSSKRVVSRLAEYGIWRPNTIAAHCVHIDDDELAILLDAGVWITHQPRSNMNNGVGAADIEKFVASGARVALGNDGFSNNMWAEWKTAYLLHKVINRDPRSANGSMIADIATSGNARLLEQFFGGQRFGVIEEGAVADLIFVDYKPYTPLNAGNLPWHILFGFEASMVTTTIVAGNVLMQDREVLVLDESAIMAEALDHAPEVWERYTRIAQNVLQS